MNADRNLQLLGIAKKAGMLAVGGDAVCTAAQTGKARLVISAIDAAPGSLRRARYATEIGRAQHVTVPYTKFELGSVVGRGSPGTIAVLDTGLAAGFVSKLAETDPERYGDAAKKLAEKADALAKKRRSAK